MAIPAFLENFTPRTSESAQTALEKFAKIGVPTKKIENWHYTDLSKLVGGEVYNTTTKIPAQSRDIDNAIKVSISSDGYIGVDYGDEEICAGFVVSGTTCVQMDTIASTENHPMALLNSAVHHDGLCLCITENIERPIHIAYVNAGDALAVMPRLFIDVKEGITTTIVETYESLAGDKIFANAVTEISVGERSVLNHYKVQDDEAQTTHISYAEVSVAALATYNQTAIFLDGTISRNESCVNLNGEKSHANMRGLYIAQGEQHIDNTVCVNHYKPNCTSEQLFKGVLNEKAKSFFQGKIYVDRIAQKTDGYQMHRSILLSRDAEVSCKPELEIYADDVKCSHGATTGEIDKDQLFYLQTRGIDSVTAKKMLLNAFLLEVLEDIKDETVANFLMKISLGKAGRVLDKY